jgi:hypothetical protein
MPASADVVAVLTGNVLKDPDHIYHYHTGVLKGRKRPAVNVLRRPPFLS